MGLLPITAYPLARSTTALGLISHKHKFIYYQVPKAGCTSIKFFIATLDSIEGFFPSLPVLDIHSLAFPKLSSAEARLSPYKDYFHFTFVRNPYDRLLSCYINRIYEPALHNRNDNLHTNGEFNRFLWQYGQLGWKKMSFGDFVQLVTRIADRSCNKHFRPQHCLLDLDLLDFIGRFENFNQDFLYVRKQIGLSDDTLHLQKMNASKHSLYQNYYNDKLRKMVARKYARDLEIFNYDF